MEDIGLNFESTEKLKAPFPYFGGKSRAAKLVWDAFGEVKNYVEPFAGSAAMLLAAPPGKRTETINDFDGMVANFWRSISKDPSAVADYADWPCNETDLFARHLWLVEQKSSLAEKLRYDHEYYDPKIAGFWVWGLCNWIGGGFCSGKGPWHRSEGEIKKITGSGGVDNRLPHLNYGRGINTQTNISRREYIHEWFTSLHGRLRDVRVASGDWSRVLTNTVTTRLGLCAIFLDPPYDRGAMDYGNGGMGLGISSDVRQWCIQNWNDKNLRIVLCGYAGEHDDLLSHGWFTKTWKAAGGYSSTEEAIQNSKSETIWCSPYCIHPSENLFDV